MKKLTLSSIVGATIAMLLSGEGTAFANLTSRSDAYSNINSYYLSHGWSYTPVPTANLLEYGKSTCAGLYCAGFHQDWDANAKSIYSWISQSSTTVSTHAVYGKIWWAYNAFGAVGAKASNSFLGFPTSEEMDTAEQSGRMQHFEGSDIYWKQGASVAHQVGGWIEARWNGLNGLTFGHGETGPLGFPISNEYADPIDEFPNSRRSEFENGYVVWDGLTSGGWQADTWPVLTEEISYTWKAWATLPSEPSEFAVIPWGQNSNGDTVIRAAFHEWPGMDCNHLFINVEAGRRLVGYHLRNYYNDWGYGGVDGTGIVVTSDDCVSVGEQSCILTLEAQRCDSPDFQIASVDIYPYL
jgi:hypothetical protein